MGNKIFTLNEFKGINVGTDVSKIDDNESPNMMNFELDVEGVLKKRTGFETVIKLGNTAINGHYIFTDKSDNSYELVACKDKLYRLDGKKATVLYTGLANNRVEFFNMKNKCYILDGRHYLEFDGSTVKEPTPYIPEMFRNNEPMEDFNLLGTRFKCTFSPNGTDTEFDLGVKPLNSEEVKISLDGGGTWKTTGFTVDKVQGKVKFNTAPSEGVATLIVEAATDNKNKKNFIAKCSICSFFGGNNDTRALLSGNSDFPNRVYRSGLYDPTYWPENGYIDVGADTEKIMGFAKQYSTLVCIKRHSVYVIGYDSSNLVFTTKPINEQTGTSAYKSIQVIDNCPVWIDPVKGVVILKQSNILDERNIEIISQKINRNLLKESNLEKAIGFDYMNKYYIFINKKVYIYDYIRKVWYMFDNMDVNTCMAKDNIVFGTSDGCINRMKSEDEDFPYNDNGKPIEAYWYSKLMNFDMDYREKTIRKMYYSIVPGYQTSIKLSIVSDTEEEKEIANEMVYLQRFDPFYLYPFSFISNSFPLSDGIKSKLKKIVYLQIKIENDVLDESLDVLSVSFDVLEGRFRK